MVAKLRIVTDFVVAYTSGFGVRSKGQIKYMDTTEKGGEKKMEQQYQYCK